jgi:hypothetical protein
MLIDRFSRQEQPNDKSEVPLIVDDVIELLSQLAIFIVRKDFNKIICKLGEHGRQPAPQNFNLSISSNNF